MIIGGVDVGAILTLILQAVLAFAIPALVAFAFTEGRALIAAARENIWAKLTAQQQANVRVIAMTAVHLAEQVYRRQDVQDAAAAKKALAEQYVNSQLAKFGISLTAQEVEAEIEAAVNQQFNNPPKAPAPKAEVAAQAAQA